MQFAHRAVLEDVEVDGRLLRAGEVVEEPVRRPGLTIRQLDSLRIRVRPR